MKDFAVVWLPLSGIREHFNWLPIPEDVEAIYLPFIRDSDGAVSDGISFSATPANLLYSILLFFQDNPPTIVMSIVRQYMLDVLEMLAQGFGEKSLESCVLNACANIRSEYGYVAAYRALKSCLDILPKSNAVKSDFVVASWCMMLKNIPEERTRYAERVIGIFPTIVMEPEYLGAWQACILTELLALAAVGDYERAKIIYELHKTDLEDPEDRRRMSRLVYEKRIDAEELDQPAFGCNGLQLPASFQATR